MERGPLNCLANRIQVHEASQDEKPLQILMEITIFFFVCFFSSLVDEHGYQRISEAISPNCQCSTWGQTRNKIGNLVIPANMEVHAPSLALQWTSTPDAGSVKTEQKRKEKLKIKIFTIIVHFTDKSIITCNPFWGYCYVCKWCILAHKLKVLLPYIKSIKFIIFIILFKFNLNSMLTHPKVKMIT
jgi:hypothetical protein